ncbi:MAG: asparagine synthase (glutamine-hydrolyzing) [Alphaproteobacteria bacterium]
MCGIAAYFAYHSDAPPVERDALLRVREAMAPRGPDGEGLWISKDRRVGMAHRRLSIIDLSDSAAQPMTLEGGRISIVYNGEIYNYRALRDELAAEGRRFTTESDTEVLLHLYDRDGPAMVQHLRGMYGFAIWDNARKGIYLARDPFGIKPLYYADDGRTLRVASQVKALLAGGNIDTSPAPAGHVGYFLLGSVPEPFTLYRGIRALPAGASLWLDTSGGGNPHLHFDLTKELAAVEPAPFDPEALREAVRDSVSHHLVSDVPVGVFLSSGMDSTTLAAMASEIKGSGIKTVTLGFDEYKGAAEDETPLAEQVAAAYGADHTTSWISRQAFEECFDDVLSAMDQPSLDGVNTYFVSKVTAEAGLKVALSGLGGDELFGGYDTFRQVPMVANTMAPFRFLPGLGAAFRFVSAPLLSRLTSSKYAGLIEYGTSYGRAYLLRRGLYMPWELPQVLDADMAREGWRELGLIKALEGTTAGIGPSRLRVSALETAWYMRNQLLRDSDWAGMAHSLEIRVPLVDVELFRRIAPMLAGRNPPGKRDLALTPATKLPGEILDRPKTGFLVPVREWSGDKGSDEGAAERGYRGWARRIYAHATA